MAMVLTLVPTEGHAKVLALAGERNKMITDDLKK